MKKGIMGLFVAAFAWWGASTVWAATVTTAGSGNWNSATVNAPWPGGTVPAAGSDIIIANGHTVTVSANVTSSPGSITIASGAQLTIGGFAITNNGPTTVNGTLLHNNTAGSKIFNGDVTINSGGTWNETAAAVMTFAGNLQNDGALTASTGAHTFSGAGKTFSGTITIPNVSVTGTYTNNGTLTVTTGLAGAGTLTQGTGATLNLDGATTTAISIGTLNASDNVNTVNYTRVSNQTLKPTAYYHLGLSGGGTKTMTGVTGISGNLTLSGTVTATPVPFTIGGNLDVGSGTTFSVNTAVLTVNGTTSVSGALTHISTTGLKTYTGNVTINSGGTWSETVAAVISFGGNLQNDGALTAGNGVHTFTGASKTFSGVNAIAITNVTVNGTYQNNGTLTVNTALAGSGTLTQGPNAILSLGGTATNALVASASENTVLYTKAGAQTVKPATYYNLTLSGTSAKTMTGVTVNNLLSMEGTATVSAAPTYGSSATLQYNRAAATTNGAEWINPFVAAGGIVITNTGSITLASAKTNSATAPLAIRSGATLASGNYKLTLGGVFTNEGAFTAGTSTVEWNGAGAQNIATGAYYNVIFSGSGIKSIGVNTTIAGNLSIAPTGSAKAGVAAGLNLPVNSLMLGGEGQVSGTWGSSSSPATSKNDTFFDLTTGYLTVNRSLAYHVVRFNPSAAPPYDTWAKAATNIQMAVDKAAGDMASAGFPYAVVLVSNGTYTVTNEIIVTNGITLRGVNGREATFISGGYPASSNRCLNISHPDAVLDGFTVSNGYVTNSAIGSGGGGILVTGGTIKNCTITRNNGAVGYGVGISVSGATVTNCIISENKNSTSSGSAGGAYAADGAMLANCLIVSNQAKNYAGIYLNGVGAVALNCEISYNYALTSCGGGAALGGTFAGCLVMGNESGGTMGGLYLARSADSAQNCTIAGNKSATSLDSAGGLFLIVNALYTPSASNNIVWGNQAGGVNSDIAGYTNKVAFSCSPDLVAGVNGNITADPMFVKVGSGFGTNAVLGDYHIVVGSPAMDSGATVAAVSNDLEGISRPLDGDGNGVATYDMGAYEAGSATDGVFRCGFSTPTNMALESLTAVFTAYVAGTNTNNLVYFWTFGDGTTSNWSSATRVVSHSYSAYGSCAVTLNVSNELGQVAVYSRPAFITVYPTYVYVTTNGTAVSPFGSWATATTNIQDAVDMATVGKGYTIAALVSNGIYTVTNEITIASPITLRGFSGNWSDTIIRGGYPASTNRCLNISDAGAVVDGFTVTNGNLGTLSIAGAGINMSAGTVQNCLVIGNAAKGAASTSYGSGIAATGGTINNCTIQNNSTLAGNGGGVYCAGAMSNCLVVGNTASRGGGVNLVGDATIDRCVIVNNSATHATTGGGGVYRSNTGQGAVRNTLIAGNQALCGGGLLSDATLANPTLLENCTVSGNLATNGGGIYAVYTGGVFSARNCIVVSNRAVLAVVGTNELACGTVNFIYSCSPDLVAGVRSNITADPMFVSPGVGYGTNLTAGNYRLKAGSLCLGAGTNMAWMATEVDLDGEPFASAPAMGAYQKAVGAASRGTFIMIR